MDVVVREAREAELGEISEMTVEVFATESLVSPEYLETLRDARARWTAPETILLVALDDGTDGLLGTVVYARPGSPLQDLASGAEAEFRMLAVTPAARGRGVGETLVQACIAQAKRDELPRIVLSTGPEMTAAHRLYERMGFRRATERDWSPSPEIELYAYVMDFQ
ncbi:MAG TPA: GNAT family N-acetyltransferase [Actinocrinis sp.]|nr:GNAT family N-acetyltransferase [Actinocrinis sp.]